MNEIGYNASQQTHGRDFQERCHRRNVGSAAGDAFGLGIRLPLLRVTPQPSPSARYTLSEGYSMNPASSSDIGYPAFMLPSSLPMT